MQCPKCGKVQDNEETCSRCGLVFEKHFQQQSAANAPLNYSYAYPQSRQRSWTKPVLVLLALGLIYGSLQVKDYTDSRSQYMVVAKAINLYSSTISIVLREHWANEGQFPESNEAAGLPDDDNGAWPDFKRVAVTGDGRIVFEYARSGGSGPEPFTLVIADHPGVGVRNWVHLCGGTGLRQKVKEWLSYFCAWDSSINTFAPPQAPGQRPARLRTAEEESERRAQAGRKDDVSPEEREALLARLDQGLTPLMHAASHGDAAETARLLKDAHAAVNARDKDGNTALMYACRSRVPEIVGALLAAGADVRLRGADGADALLWALKKIPAVPGQQQGGNPPLANRLVIVDKLLARGVSLGTADQLGQNALHYAADEGDTELLEFLLGRGANIEAPDTRGRTPLMHAALVASGDGALTLLIKHGANVNARDAANASVLKLVLDRPGPAAERRYVLLRNAGAR